jgi:hypothetical protein
MADSLLAFFTLMDNQDGIIVKGMESPQSPPSPRRNMSAAFWLQTSD